MESKLFGCRASTHPEKSQSCGTEAKEYLSAAILGKTIACTSTKHDRYGRTIGKISFNGTDVNKMMIADGYAWHYKRYKNRQPSEDRASYASAEASARSGGTGCLIAGAVPPWEYRRNRFFAQYYPRNYPRSPDYVPNRVISYDNDYFPNGSGSSGSGGPVQVKGYIRKDGTVVQPHTRAKPRR